MTDHWDHDDTFDLDVPDDHTPVHEPLDHDPLGHDMLDHDMPGHDDPPGHDPLGHDGTLEHGDLPDAGDGHQLLDLAETPDGPAGDTLFPPALDVDLPEPVDGFPWIDTSTLGAADPTGFLPPVENVTAHELAAYAGIEIPDGADPWEVLTASDDPATAALARWWTGSEQ